MTSQRLDEILHALHEELTAADQLDADQVAGLRQALGDIQERLGEQSEETTIVDRLRESAKHFEETHPTLTNTIGQLADMLQRMGI